MARLEFRCPSCRRRLRIPRAQEGLRCRCPACGSELRAERRDGVVTAAVVEPAAEHARARALLGLAEGFDLAELEAAYRRKIAAYHPGSVREMGTDIRKLADRRTGELHEAFALLRAGGASPERGGRRPAEGLSGPAPARDGAVPGQADPDRASDDGSPSRRPSSRASGGPLGTRGARAAVPHAAEVPVADRPRPLLLVGAGFGAGLAALVAAVYLGVELHRTAAGVSHGAPAPFVGGPPAGVVVEPPATEPGVAPEDVAAELRRQTGVVVGCLAEHARALPRGDVVQLEVGIDPAGAVRSSDVLGVDDVALEACVARVLAAVRVPAASKPVSVKLAVRRRADGTFEPVGGATVM